MVACAIRAWSCTWDGNAQCPETVANSSHCGQPQKSLFCCCVLNAVAGNCFVEEFSNEHPYVAKMVMTSSVVNSNSTENGLSHSLVEFVMQALPRRCLIAIHDCCLAFRSHNFLLLHSAWHVLLEASYGVLADVTSLRNPSRRTVWTASRLNNRLCLPKWVLKCGCPPFNSYFQMLARAQSLSFIFLGWVRSNLMKVLFCSLYFCRSSVPLCVFLFLYGHVASIHCALCTGLS